MSSSRKLDCQLLASCQTPRLGKCVVLQPDISEKCCLCGLKTVDRSREAQNRSLSFRPCLSTYWGRTSSPKEALNSTGHSKFHVCVHKARWEGPSTNGPRRGGAACRKVRGSGPSSPGQAVGLTGIWAGNLSVTRVRKTVRGTAAPEPL